MSELWSFLCFRLYSLNFVISHARHKIILFIRIGLTLVALKHKKTYLSVTSNGYIRLTMQYQNQHLGGPLLDVCLI